MESNPQEAWELLAALEFAGPGGMTGLPLLRATLSNEDRRTIKARQIRKNTRRLATARESENQVVGKLNTSVPSVTPTKRKLRTRLPEMIFRLPSVLTTDEMALILRRHPEAVRRMARSKRLMAFGNPYRFPARQLIDFGINLEDAAADLESPSYNSSTSH
jgi:hypothetical protein